MGSRLCRQIATNPDGSTAMWTPTASGRSSPCGTMPSLFTKAWPTSAPGRPGRQHTLTTRGGSYGRAEMPNRASWSFANDIFGVRYPPGQPPAEEQDHELYEPTSRRAHHATRMRHYWISRGLWTARPRRFKSPSEKP